MTSTPVRDVSSVLANLAAAPTGKGTAGNGDFHKVWSSQMSKGTTDSMSRDSNVQGNTGKKDSTSPKTQETENQAVQKEDGRETEELQPTDQKETEVSSVDQKADDPVSRTPDDQDSTEAVSRVPEEGLEEIMEVIGTALGNFMEQIADAFDISMEELQTAMDELGISRTDLLDASKLGELLLGLGGAKDSYALITDEKLYDNYRMLMGQLDTVLQDCADELGAEPEALLTLLKEGFGEETVPENMLTAEGTEDTPEQPAAAANSEAPVITVEVDGVQEEQTASGQGREQMTGGEKHSGEKADKGEQMNLFAQNPRMENFQPELQTAREVPGNNPWNAETRQIMNQILDYMKLQLNAETTNLEMQLHPASLGTVQVQLASKGGMVTANFIAQNETVKAALESQMVQLREQFEQQGVKVEAIEVTVQTHEFERNLEQGRGRNQQESGRRGRARRINTGDRLTMEDLEEEDALRADMLAADGSTVSYTV